MPDLPIIDGALKALEKRRDDLIGAIGFGNANSWQPGQLAGLQADIDALLALKYPSPSMHSGSIKYEPGAWRQRSTG